MRFTRALLAAVLVCLPFYSSAQVTPPGQCQGKACGTQVAPPLPVSCPSRPGGICTVQDTLEEHAALIAAGGGGGGGGSSIILNLGDNGSTESTGITVIASTNDTYGVMTMPISNKLLFDFSHLLFRNDINSETDLQALLAGLNVLTANDFLVAGTAPVATGPGAFVQTDIATQAELDAAVIGGGGGSGTVTGITADTGGTTTDPTPSLVGGTGINTFQSGGDTITINSEVIASESGAQHLCNDGVTLGGGLGADDKYAWTCALGWSALKGGTLDVGGGARVAAWDTATTPGGNSYRINCTGPGVGVTQDGTVVDVTTNLALGAGNASGGSTSTVEHTGVTYAVSALRGYYVYITAGTGSGQSRQILENDADTITIGGSSLFSPAPDDTSTYEIYNLYPSNCYAVDEVVVLNTLADFMISQEMTRAGGTTYAGDLTNGKAATIYVHTGAGRKGMGNGTTPFVGNNYPVLPRQNDSHYQAFIQFGFRNVKFDMGPRDADLFEPTSGKGRRGVYLVEDTGGVNSASDYYDPADKSKYQEGRPIITGGQSIGTGGANICHPVSTTDSRCNVAVPNNTLSYAWWMDARSYTVGSAAHTADVTNPTQICVTNQLSTYPNNGVCEDDPRIMATGAGVRTGIDDGGCDFGPADPRGTGGDLGPAEGMAAAIEAWSYTRPDRFRQIIELGQGVQNFPGATFTDTQDNVFAHVAATSPLAGACGGGTGRYIDTSNDTTYDTEWVLNIGTFDFGTGATGSGLANPKITWIHPDWYSPDGGLFGGTIMPNGWWGRDVNGDGNSDPGDCLSAGDFDFTDDESGCDSKTLMSIQNIYRAGIQHSLVAYCSHDTQTGAGSCVDSADHGYYMRNYDNMFLRGKRGRLADWTGMNAEEILVEDHQANDGSAVLAIGYNSRGRYDKITVRQSSGAGCVVGPTAARHVSITNLNIIGCNLVGTGVGQLRIGGGDVLVDGFKISGGSWPPISISNGFGNLHGVHLRNGSIFGMQVGGTGLNQQAARTARAAIVVTRNADNSGILLDGTNTIGDITVDNVNVESQVTDSLLMAFDDNTTAPNNTVNKSRATTRITNSGITCIAGATGCKAFAVGTMSHPTTGGILNPPFSALNDTGLLNEQYVPSWRGIQENGFMIPDQPFPQDLTAGPHGTNDADGATGGWALTSLNSCGDCDNPGLAGRVCHIADDTAANACTDATSDGILDGGGAARSLCTCGTDTNWVAP